MAPHSLRLLHPNRTGGGLPHVSLSPRASCYDQNGFVPRPMIRTSHTSCHCMRGGPKKPRGGRIDVRVIASGPQDSPSHWGRSSRRSAAGDEQEDRRSRAVALSRPVRCSQSERWEPQMCRVRRNVSIKKSRARNELAQTNRSLGSFLERYPFVSAKLMSLHARLSWSWSVFVVQRIRRL